MTAEDDTDPAVVDAARHPAQVRAVYDEIATHFAKTRAYPWPEVEAFLDGRRGKVGLDLGCGNGRHGELLAERTDTVLAVDVSRQLLFEARERMARNGWTMALLQGDAAHLPVTSDTVDLGVYVATLHHLPDRESRVGSLDGLARVLAPDGRALVSAWSTAHDRFEAAADAAEGFDTTVEWTLPGDESIERFYHIYAPAELERDLESSALAVEDVFISSGNCYAVVRGRELR